MALRLLFILSTVLADINTTNGYYCMSDLSTKELQPTLYMRVCCLVNNVGKTVRMREGYRLKIIICPSVLLDKCPGNNNATTNSLRCLAK